MKNNSSPHILNTSSNLLGFTFLVFSSIRGLGLAQGTAIDEIMSVCIVIFATSSFLSFVSIRALTEEKTDRYELWAEYVFLTGLTIITAVSVLLVFDVIIFRT